MSELNRDAERDFVRHSRRWLNELIERFLKDPTSTLDMQDSGEVLVVSPCPPKVDQIAVFEQRWTIVLRRSRKVTREDVV